MLQRPLTQLAHCHSDCSKCVPLAHRQALPTRQYQLYSVEGRAKCPTVPQRHEIVTGTRAVEQGSK